MRVPGKRMIFIGLLGLVFVILLWNIYNGKTDKKELIDSNKTCNVDSDCVIQQTTCCPCSAGGKIGCFNKEGAKAINDSLQSCTGDICLSVYACPESMFCKCVEGICQNT